MVGYTLHCINGPTLPTCIHNKALTTQCPTAGQAPSCVLWVGGQSRTKTLHKMSTVVTTHRNSAVTARTDHQGARAWRGATVLRLGLGCGVVQGEGGGVLMQKVNSLVGQLSKCFKDLKYLLIMCNFNVCAY